MMNIPAAAGQWSVTAGIVTDIIPRPAVFRNKTPGDGKNPICCLWLESEQVVSCLLPGS